MPVILLIRHGQASFGATDYDVLSDLGAEQLTALHRSLRDESNVQALVTGDLRRQRDSARPWTRDGAALAIDDRWNEYDSDDVMRAYGESQVSLEAPEGERHAATSRQFQEALDVGLAKWVRARESSDAAESWTAFQSRCIGALHDLAATLGRGETGLAFTSGGVVAACAAALLDAPDEVFITLNRTAVNAGVTKVLVGARGLSLASYNEHSHLRAAQVTYR
jgi:broad specificity phosphatase PhoE